MQTHSWMPRSASVVSRKGKGWCAGSGCTWMGSVTDMGISHSSSTRTILPRGLGDSLPAGLSCPPSACSAMASPSSSKLFVSSAASLTSWSVSQERTWRIRRPCLLYLCDWCSVCAPFVSIVCLDPRLVLLQILAAPLSSSLGWWFKALPPLMKEASRKCECLCLMHADLCSALLADISSRCECVLCVTQMLGLLHCQGGDGRVVVFVLPGVSVGYGSEQAWVKSERWVEHVSTVNGGNMWLKVLRADLELILMF